MGHYLSLDTMASSASAIPLSEIIRSKDDAVVGDKGKSGDEWKKARELEEMRKVRNISDYLSCNKVFFSFCD